MKSQLSLRTPFGALLRSERSADCRQASPGVGSPDHKLGNGDRPVCPSSKFEALNQCTTPVRQDPASMGCVCRPASRTVAPLATSDVTVSGSSVGAKADSAVKSETEVRWPA